MNLLAIHSDFETVWERAERVPSPHLPCDHAELLYTWAGLTGGIAVEIGSWQGRSSVILGSALREAAGQLFCVDHWGLVGGAEVVMDRDYWVDWQRTVREWNLTDTVVPLRGLSHEIAATWPAGQGIDLLFIDGSHVYREAGPLMLDDATIQEYGIHGWLKNGERLPIDAHRPWWEHGVKVDFDAWTPKVKPGGLLIMHDVGVPQHPDVDRVWREEVAASPHWRVLHQGTGIALARRQ